MTNTTFQFNSMKLRLWRRRMSVSSPRLKIRNQLPWPMRILIVGLIGVAGAVAMWTYDAGHGEVDASSAPAQLSSYTEQIDALKAERDRYSSTVNAAESQLNIERAAQKQLGAQVKALEAENTRLKEDLAFFESLLPNAIGPQGISIRNLKVDPLAPNQLRYRLLIIQGGNGSQMFQGTLQLVATTMQGDKSVMMTFPEANPSDQEKFKLRFKYYQRVEGVITLPEGATTKSVQARVLDKGQIRAQLSANL